MESVIEVNDDASDSRGTAAEQEAAFWKRKFEELQALRMTAPEQRLANLTTKLDAQEASMKKMASSVRGMLQRSRVVSVRQRKSSAENVEVLTQQEEEEELAEDAEYDVAADSETVELLEAKLEQKREVLRFYQKLTGIVVEPLTPEDDESSDSDGAEEDTMSCTAINHIHKRAVKFELQLADGGDQVVFVPVANQSLLPTTLRVSLLLLAFPVPLPLTRSFLWSMTSHLPLFFPSLLLSRLFLRSHYAVLCRPENSPIRIAATADVPAEGPETAVCVRRGRVMAAITHEE